MCRNIRTLANYARPATMTALDPNYYWGYLWCAANAAAAGSLDEARRFVELARAIQPDVSITLVRQSLGSTAPDVDRRLAGFLAQAGLGE